MEKYILIDNQIARILGAVLVLCCSIILPIITEVTASNNDQPNKTRIGNTPTFWQKINPLIQILAMIYCLVFFRNLILIKLS